MVPVSNFIGPWIIVPVSAIKLSRLIQTIFQYQNDYYFKYVLLHRNRIILKETLYTLYIILSTTQILLIFQFLYIHKSSNLTESRVSSSDST